MPDEKVLKKGTTVKSFLIRIQENETTKHKYGSFTGNISLANPLISHITDENDSEYTAHSNCRRNTEIPESTSAWQ